MTWVLDPTVPDTVVEDTISANVAFNTPALPHARVFMPYALLVPGALHVIHNVSKDAEKQLTHWMWFHGRLKSLEKLLATPHLRERYVAKCLTPGNADAPVFKRTFPKLYEKRWEVVATFCKKLIENDLLNILARTWDSVAFFGPKGGELNPTDVDESAGQDVVDLKDLGFCTMISSKRI